MAEHGRAFLPRSDRESLAPESISQCRDLITAIFDSVDHHIDNPKPFVCTAKAADIMEKVKRGRTALHNRQSA